MRALLATTLALVTGCGSAVERSLIYYPTRRLEATPADYGLAFEDVRVTAEDGVHLHGWYVPGARSVALLWSHGNAGNISHRLENLHRLHRRLGVAVLLFDYRGYGQSEGTPSEPGTYRDARAFRAWLRRREATDAKRIVYFGRSLGAAVAAALAVDDPPAALILETPFTSVRAMANATLPGAGYLLRTRYDTLARIAEVRVPVLVLHGDADEVVPFRQGRAVFEAAREPKVFFTITGARHNDTYLVGGAAYWEAWERFLATHVAGWEGRR
ncbi:MAG: alpha/beta hydrolase [Candidatus Rokubacteria bacterium]|nr:alpha/beta hydrolase [Candidatus Rokubacteria bacterium]